MAATNRGAASTPAATRGAPQVSAPEAGEPEISFANDLSQIWRVVKIILAPIASLKLTVILFALSIFLILVGTTAQDDLDMHDVLSRYFRTWVAQVDFNDLFPKAFFPAVPDLQIRVPRLGGQPLVIESFPFFGGKTIGLLLAFNLVAAHLVRFTVQARGLRLAAGLIVMGMGMLVTLAVIISGMSKGGFQTIPWLSWDRIWFLFQVGLAGLDIATFVGFLLVQRQRALQRWSMLAVAVMLGAILAWLVVMGEKVQLEDSYMRILWLLMKGIFAGLVLLTGAVLVFGKRGGVVLLHGGVGLMMLGELYVAMKAVEGQMGIPEGETVSYVQHIQLAELAVIDPSNPRHDDVVAVPQSLFVPAGGTDDGKRVEHKSLPFDLQVVRYYKNSSRVRKLQPGETTPATAGLGATYTVDEAAPSSGTDMDSAVNLASAWVSVFPKDSREPLGTYLLTMQLTGPEEIPLAGKNYHVYLRFKRTYKPYAIKLVDVRKEDYVGTSTPKDYRSKVVLTDARNRLNEEHEIWMNNPMRYAGETFYQSNYSKDPRTGAESTTLQVVTNDSWMIPYVSCALVGVGLLFHFGAVLWRFLTRLSSDPVRYGADQPVPLPNRKDLVPQATGTDVLSVVGWILTVGVVLMAAVFLASRAYVRSTPAGQSTKAVEKGKTIKIDESVTGEIKMEVAETTKGQEKTTKYEAKNVDELKKNHPAAHLLYEKYSRNLGDLYRFGKLPVAHDGRVKPFDTLARNALRVISDSETFTMNRGDEAKGEEAKGDKQPAIRWLLDVITQRPEANDYQVFRIDHPELQKKLGLPRRKSLRYSVNEIKDKFQVLEELSNKMPGTPEEKLTTLQRRAVELERRLRQYIVVSVPFRPYPLPRLPKGKALANNPEAKQTLTRIAQELQQDAAQLRDMDRPTVPRAVPVAEPVKKLEQMPWEPYAIAAGWQAYHEQLNLPDNPAADQLTAILDAYRRKDAVAFNRAMASYEKALKEQPPQEYSATKNMFESFFSHFEPFFCSSWLYFGAILLTFVGWLLAVVGGGKPLHRCAFWLMVFTLLVHTVALAVRIYISGRPPVTNLYSSAVFIGWGGVVFGLVLELIFDLAIGKKLGIGNLVAGTAGFGALLISQKLAGDGDTYAVLQAVLDTQFWLATHVVCITLGYAATLVAGLLGMIYIVAGLFTPAISPKVNRILTTMIYGVLCFAIFFSFVGTVLGGLWADDSWGRFWGWDPKENGALIIVIWNALVLHARWDGMVRDRGLATLAVAGMITTTWSWFGVNELGIGLHSYGFTEGTKMWLGIFCLIIFPAFIILGSLPREWWWSFRRNELPPALPTE